MNDHQQPNWPEDDPGERSAQWPSADEPGPQWPGQDEQPHQPTARGQAPQWPGPEQAPRPHQQQPRGQHPPNQPQWPQGHGGDAHRPQQGRPQDPRQAPWQAQQPPQGARPPQAGQGPPPPGQHGGRGHPPPQAPGQPARQPDPTTQHRPQQSPGAPWARQEGGQQRPIGGPAPSQRTEQPTGYVESVDDSVPYEPDLFTHQPDDPAGFPGEPREPDGDDEPHVETELNQDGKTRSKSPLGPKQRRRRRWKIVRRMIYALVGVFFVLPALAFTITYFIVEVPQPEQVASRQGQILVYKYANGEVMGKVAPTASGHRVILEPHQIPELVKHAVYAAETAEFETNPGFSITGIARAAWGQISGDPAGGGSTITQQYIKQATGYDDHTYVRKFIEIVKAFKMKNQMSNAQIITAYLNTIYFGRGAYGIQAAAQAYFDKDVDELTKSEAALLAGMIQAPSNYDNTEYMKNRWNYVMDQMVKNGWLSPAKRKAAEFPDMISLEKAGLDGMSGSKAFIAQRVKDELASKGFSEKELRSGGYTIVTTIDPRAQRLAVQAVHSVMKNQPKDLSEALVAVDPQTGAVRAYYGGPNNETDRIDGADILRNPGSSFKPFDLVALLQTGQGLSKMYNGDGPRMIAGHMIHNANSTSASCKNMCTVAKAMKISANTVFVDMVVNDVGVKAVRQAAHAAGIPYKYHGKPTMGHGFNIAIGGGKTNVTVTQMAGAYATFASGGIRHETHFVAKLINAEGEVVYKANYEGELAFAPQNPQKNEQIAHNVTRALIPVLDHAGLSCPPGYDCAGKTGTDEASNDTNTGTNQAWMVGYTPGISVAAWVGTTGNGTIRIEDAQGNPIFGADLPGSIWETFMQSYLKGKPKLNFPSRAEIELIGGPLPSGDDQNERAADRDARREDEESQDEDSEEQTDSTTTTQSNDRNDSTGPTYPTFPTDPTDPTGPTGSEDTPGEPDKPTIDVDPPPPFDGDNRQGFANAVESERRQPAG